MLEQVQTYTAVEVIAHHFCNNASSNPNFKLLCQILQIAVTLPTDTLESQVFMTLMKQGPRLLQEARPLTQIDDGSVTLDDVLGGGQMRGWWPSNS